MIQRIHIKRVLLLCLITVFYNTSLAKPKIRIITSLPDLTDIAQKIGGKYVTAEALAKGYQDPHFVDAKPSSVLKLKKADLFIQIGLDLERGWVPLLLEAARNRKIYFGGQRYINASGGIHLLQIPTEDTAQLRAKGDIHIHGNPHYWLDPLNGKIIAKNICDRLIQVLPDRAKTFQNNLKTFHMKIDSALSVWQKKMASYRGVEIIAYHNSWPYFEKRFDLKIADFIEPKPGIPPTPSHLMHIVQLINKRKIKAIIISPYFDDRSAQSIAARTNTKIVRLAPSVGAFTNVNDYFSLFDYNINTLVTALKQHNVQTDSFENPNTDND